MKGPEGGSRVVDHSTHDREEEGSKPVTGEDRGESFKNQKLMNGSNKLECLSPAGLSSLYVMLHFSLFGFITKKRAQ
jgi:hypothetical protein